MSRRAITLCKTFEKNGQVFHLDLKYSVFMGDMVCRYDTPPDDPEADFYVAHCQDPQGNDAEVDEDSIPEILGTTWEVLDEEALKLAFDQEEEAIRAALEAEASYEEMVDIQELLRSKP